MRCPVADVEDDYQVGYGKPPKETKFMKGRSGNPKGRPKGSRNLASSFIEIGRERITVTEAGRTRTMTKADAVVYQLTNKAASGDPRARREYFQVHKMLQPPEPSEEIAPDLSDRDKEVMKNFLKRMDRMGKTKSDEPSTPNTMETKEETE
jgi:Family of unknown function (DUF5681)